MTHALKTWPQYYKAIECGDKTFEIRLHDRPFKVGEVLLLQEFDDKTGTYTGKELRRRISYTLKGGRFGIDARYLVMGIQEVIE